MPWILIIFGTKGLSRKSLLKFLNSFLYNFIKSLMKLTIFFYKTKSLWKILNIFFTKLPQIFIETQQFLQNFRKSLLKLSSSVFFYNFCKSLFKFSNCFLQIFRESLLELFKGYFQNRCKSLLKLSNRFLQNRLFGPRFEFDIL